MLSGQQTGGVHGKAGKGVNALARIFCRICDSSRVEVEVPGVVTTNGETPEGARRKKHHVKGRMAVPRII